MWRNEIRGGAGLLRGAAAGEMAVGLGWGVGMNTRLASTTFAYTIRGQQDCTPAR
jgi:hypothetical protein